MPTKRDKMHRCPYCKQLYKDEECTTDTKSGVLICPKGCEPTFNQPPYESPLNNED